MKSIIKAEQYVRTLIAHILVECLVAVEDKRREGWAKNSEDWNSGVFVAEDAIYIKIKDLLGGTTEKADEFIKRIKESL